MAHYDWKTKLQAYLAKIAGYDVTLPAPVNKEQALLKEIAEEYVMIPAYTSSDKGKVFAVNEDGNGVEWVTPGGGGGSGGLVVNVTYDNDTSTYTADKTAGEIYEACPFVVAVEADFGSTVYQLGAYVFSNDEGYRFLFVGQEDLTFTAASADDYPTMDMGGGGET